MLSEDEIGAFLADGYVAVRGAVPAPVIAACQDVIWAELDRQGVRREDPATWAAPRPGSHRDVPPILAPAGDEGMPWLPAAQQAARASAHRPTAQATGQAGDVFLCHPFLVHAASWPHRGRFPRMIAQPGVALYGQYALLPGPGETPPPVEQAILGSLAAAS